MPVSPEAILVYSRPVCTGSGPVWEHAAEFTTVQPAGVVGYVANVRIVIHIISRSPSTGIVSRMTPLGPPLCWMRPGDAAGGWGKPPGLPLPACEIPRI